MGDEQNYLKKELYERFGKNNVIFDFLQDAALDGIWYWDLEQPEHEWMSPKFWDVLGYDHKTKKHLASEWQKIIYQADLAVVKKAIDAHLSNANIKFDEVVRYHHKNGSTVWIRCRGIAIRDTNGKAVRLLGAHTDITDVMRSHHDMQALKKEYETVFDGSQDALFLIEVHGYKDFTFVRNNLSHQRKTGVTLEMIEGKSPSDLLGEDAGDLVNAHYQQCVDEADVISYEESLQLPAGKRIWSTTLTPIFTKGVITHIVGSAMDITNQKTLEKKLLFQANHDTLTGLPNRSYLSKYIDELTEKNASFTFLFLDLNDFKPVNDRYGHDAGDYVLKTIAKRIKSLSREHDFLARLGGDEFVVIKSNQPDIYTVNDCMNRLKTIIEEPIVLNQNKLNVGVSIGYAKYPQDGLSYDTLAKIADKRMYEKKADKTLNQL